MLLLWSPLSTLTAYSGVHRVNDLFVYLIYYAAEHLRIYLALSRDFVRSPRLLYAFVSRENGGGRRRCYRGLRTILCYVCGDQFGTLGYGVRAVLRSNLRPDSSQPVLVVVGAKRAKPLWG